MHKPRLRDARPVSLLEKQDRSHVVSVGSYQSGGNGQNRSRFVDGTTHGITEQPLQRTASPGVNCVDDDGGRADHGSAT